MRLHIEYTEEELEDLNAFIDLALQTMDLNVNDPADLPYLFAVQKVRAARETFRRLFPKTRARVNQHG